MKGFLLTFTKSTGFPVFGAGPKMQLKQVLYQKGWYSLVSSLIRCVLREGKRKSEQKSVFEILKNWMLVVF